MKTMIAETKNKSATCTSATSKICLQLDDSLKADTYAIEQFISFLYTGEIRFRDAKDAETVIHLANRYGINSLPKLCEDFLLDSLQQDDLDMAMKTFQKAQDLQLNRLLTKCKLIFCLNFEYIPELFWKALKADVIREIIRSSFVIVKNESIVLDRLMLWLDGQDDQQKALHLHRMIKYIRFVHMSSKQLMDFETHHGKVINESRPHILQEAFEMRAIIAEAIQVIQVQEAAKKKSKSTSKYSKKVLDSVCEIPSPRIYWQFSVPGSPQVGSFIFWTAEESMAQWLDVQVLLRK